MKKFSFLLCLIGASTISICAQSGTTGSLSWSISGGTLTISGNGAMPDYNGNAPWSSYYSSITSVVIENGVTSIGAFAFPGFSIVSVTIPNSVSSIGNSTFAGCGNLVSITIPNSVSSIGSSAFTGCANLVSFTIPNSVSSIGAFAFTGCKFTEFINQATTPQTINADVFASVNITACTLRVPASSIPAYQIANVWNSFANIVATEEKVSYFYDLSGNQILRKIQEISMSTTTTSSSSAASMLKSTASGTGASEVATKESPKYEDVLSEMKITIYPNPTRGMLRVDISGSYVSKDARIYLYNIQGALITQLTDISETNDLDISSQPEGTYIMRIMLDKNNISTWKIIKE